MVKSPLPLAFLLALAPMAGAAPADLRLFGVAAVGEVPRSIANDMAGSGALWQGGLSLEAEAAFAMAFLRPWLAWYDGGPAYEAAVGAGIGLPIRWISGHAWAGAEASLASVRVPTFPGTGGPGTETDGGGKMVPRRESRRAFGPWFRLDAWRGFGALTFLSDAYPMWRIELGYRLMSW